MELHNQTPPARRIVAVIVRDVLTIASLIGHKKASVTSKYAHKADAVLLQAADTVADRIVGLMGDAHLGGAVISFPARRG
jgi:hypothetical protein